MSITSTPAGGTALAPPAARTAVEFRHASWLDEEVYAVLRARNAALCVADTEESSTTVVPTADFGYLRLRDRVYGPDELAMDDDRRATGVADAFVYFKYEEYGTGPAQAREPRGPPRRRRRRPSPD